MKVCPKCGCPLQITNLDRYWCPNCFKVIEEEKESEEGAYTGYLG